MFEQRNNPILNTNIILHDKQRKMNGLDSIFQCSRIGKGGEGEEVGGNFKFIMFMKTSKQLCSTIHLGTFLAMEENSFSQV